MAQYRIAKAQQEEASLAFQQTLLKAGSEVNDALVACQTSKAKTVLFEKQIQSLEKALESTSLLMEHGTTTYLEVLTARQSLLSAQLSQTANRYHRNTKRDQSVSGFGWRQRIRKYFFHKNQMPY